MKRKYPVFLTVLIMITGLLIPASCQRAARIDEKGDKTMAQKTLTDLNLSSSAFVDGDCIPRKYTGGGEDVSPPLAWTPGPAGTVSYVLIVDDPDAPVGVWDHWVLINIPADKVALEEGVPKDPKLSDGSIQGKNGWGQVGYRGPAPPRGKPHRYIFNLYAIDITLDAAPGSDKKTIEKMIQGHILGKGQLVGFYQRS